MIKENRTHTIGHASVTPPARPASRGGRRPGAGRKKGTRTVTERNRVIGKTVYLTGEEWAWIETWLPGAANPTLPLRDVLDRARKFWPNGPTSNAANARKGRERSFLEEFRDESASQ